ncbi:sigma-54 factor interaction domain-containing protein, partial [Candidatus Parcubacteria bacterium]
MNDQVRLLVLIRDVSDVARLEYTARQQEYEIELLRNEVAVKAGFISDSILGHSPRMKEVRQFVEKIAGHPTTVLLRGESGTGKSLLARVIHRASSCSKGPFVEINCAAIPDTLLESELFGYAKGAFTHAVQDKRGLIEEADGGTLFLDEIGEMPLSLQAKLLTFLETKTLRRLGSNTEIRVNVRLIAATNRDLQEAVAQNQFREDLYYRINVVSLVLP